MVGPGNRIRVKVSRQDGLQFPALGRVGRYKGIVHPHPFPAVVDPAGVFELGQVSRYGGLREFQRRHEIADAELLFGQKERQDPETGFIGKGLE